jgi:hypothetical protein
VLVTVQFSTTMAHAQVEGACCSKPEPVCLVTLHVTRVMRQGDGRDNSHFQTDAINIVQAADPYCSNSCMPVMDVHALRTCPTA